MNQSEFAVWWSDFHLRFATTAGWIRADNQPDKPQVLDMLLDTWAETLADVALADCLEVNRQMQSGDLDTWGKNSDMIPQTVRRHARAIAWAKIDSDVDADLPLPPRGSNGLRFGEMQRYVSYAIEHKLPDQIWKPEALKRLGDVPKDREPRHKCPTCRDTGFVQVFTKAAISAFKAGSLAALKQPRVCVTGCVCRQVRKWMRTFDDREFCRVLDNGKSDRDLAALHTFINEGPLQGDFADFNRAAGHIA